MRIDHILGIDLKEVERQVAELPDGEKAIFIKDEKNGPWRKHELTFDEKMALAISAVGWGDIESVSALIMCFDPIELLFGCVYDFAVLPADADPKPEEDSHAVCEGL